MFSFIQEPIALMMFGIVVLSLATGLQMRLTRKHKANEQEAE